MFVQRKIAHRYTYKMNKPERIRRRTWNTNGTERRDVVSFSAPILLSLTARSRIFSIVNSYYLLKVAYHYLHRINKCPVQSRANMFSNKYDIESRII